MIPVTQRIVGSGNPEPGQPTGDCWKCCIASILELPYEEVPHFMSGEWLVDPEDGRPPYRSDGESATNDWLKTKGTNMYIRSTRYMLRREDWPKEEPRRRLAPYERRTNPGYNQGFWISTVVSENFPDTAHAVVMEGSKVAFDPSPNARKTPYQFIGETIFVVDDAAQAFRNRTV